MTEAELDLQNNVEGAKRESGVSKQKKRNKINRIKKRSKQIPSHRKLPLSFFQQPNRFLVLQTHTEAMIESIIDGKKTADISTKYKKCKKCGYKKSCSIGKTDCKAVGKTCKACFKKNHFPSSLNCKKTKKIKFRLSTNGKIFFGCQTLRSFLKCKNFKLKASLVPFETLMAKDSLKCQSGFDYDKDFVFEKIRQRVIFLECKKDSQEKYDRISKDEKFFLIYYILLNLKYLWIENVDDAEEIYGNEEIGNRALFLENYVEKDESRSIQDLKNKLSMNEELIETYSKQFKECFVAQVDGMIDLSSSIESLSTSEEIVETSLVPAPLLLQVDGNNDKLGAESSLAPFS